jgi:hypothetical protein
MAALHFETKFQGGIFSLFAVLTISWVSEELQMILIAMQ